MLTLYSCLQKLLQLRIICVVNRNLCHKVSTKLTDLKMWQFRVRNIFIVVPPSFCGRTDFTNLIQLWCEFSHRRNQRIIVWMPSLSDAKLNHVESNLSFLRPFIVIAYSNYSWLECSQQIFRGGASSECWISVSQPPNSVKSVPIINL